MCGTTVSRLTVGGVRGAHLNALVGAAKTKTLLTRAMASAAAAVTAEPELLAYLRRKLDVLATERAQWLRELELASAGCDAARSRVAELEAELLGERAQAVAVRAELAALRGDGGAAGEFVPAWPAAAAVVARRAGAARGDAPPGGDVAQLDATVDALRRELAAAAGRDARRAALASDACVLQRRVRRCTRENLLLRHAYHARERDAAEATARAVAGRRAAELQLQSARAAAARAAREAAEDAAELQRQLSELRALLQNTHHAATPARGATGTPSTTAGGDAHPRLARFEERGRERGEVEKEDEERVAQSLTGLVQPAAANAAGASPSEGLPPARPASPLLPPPRATRHRAAAAAATSTLNKSLVRLRVREGRHCSSTHRPATEGGVCGDGSRAPSAPLSSLLGLPAAQQPASRGATSTARERGTESDADAAEEAALAREIAALRQRIAAMSAAASC